MSIQNIHGLDGFIWSYGCVEDRDDPLLLGRCKVRYLIWHEDDKKEIPTKDLPWSYPLLPLDSQGHVVGPKEGDWVVGFFRDGILAQEPVMWGIFKGIPERVKDPNKGFADPRTDLTNVPRDPLLVTQKTDGSGSELVDRAVKTRYPDPRFLHESHANRYERGYKDNGAGDMYLHLSSSIYNDENGLHVKQKADDAAQQTNIKTAAHIPGWGSDVNPVPAMMWNEEVTPYAAKYPYNHAWLSESGHLTEVDDTPGHERLHWYHRSGTFREIHPLGGLVEKIVDNEQHIVLKSRMTHIEAADYETVDWGKSVKINNDGKADAHYNIHVGPGSNFNIFTEKGELNINITGDVNLYSSGNVNVRCKGNLHAEVDNDAVVHVTKNLTAHVDKDAHVHVLGSLNTEVEGSEVRTVHGNMTETIDGTYTRTVKGSIVDTANVSYNRKSPIIRDSCTDHDIQATNIKRTSTNEESSVKTRFAVSGSNLFLNAAMMSMQATDIIQQAAPTISQTGTGAVSFITQDATNVTRSASGKISDTGKEIAISALAFGKLSASLLTLDGYRVKLVAKPAPVGAELAAMTEFFTTTAGSDPPYYSVTDFTEEPREAGTNGPGDLGSEGGLIYHMGKVVLAPDGAVSVVSGSVGIAGTTVNLSGTVSINGVVQQGD